MHACLPCVLLVLRRLVSAGPFSACLMGFAVRVVSACRHSLGDWGFPIKALTYMVYVDNLPPHSYVAVAMAVY